MNRRLPAVVLCGLLMMLVGCGHDEESAAGDLPTSPTEPRSIHYPRWQTPEPGDFHGYNQRASLLQRGRLVYQNNCAGCHGDDGRGYGPAAERLITRPRDFTSGIYKFRSTDSSSLPLESDLHRTITYGLPSVSMPAFPLMTERDKVAVIQYIKDFYPDWHEEADRR
ncbi:MAG: cytochrome c, partial [Phycisphaeraceae bacterium]|nr:cytochrome c [Phycisphaeraceae bacterium]